MTNLAIWAAFAKHKTPVFLLMLLSILANIIALSGFFNTDPTLQFIGLGQGLRGGWISGVMGWIDPSVGYITQPLGHLAASDWMHGMIPWWNPYSGIGMPLAAETQTSAFFLPFILLLHFDNGWLLLRVILQAGCGVFGYMLFVELGLSRTASFLGAALYALSPEFLLCPSAPIAPLPFLPLLLLGIEYSANAAAHHKRMGWSLIAIACTYSFYAGNPEVAYLNGLLAGLWSIWRFAGLPRGAKLRFLGKLCLGVGIATCLCAPLLIPAIQYFQLAYISAHAGGFSLIILDAADIPLQILPFLYGRILSPTPAALAAAFGAGYVRVPGWVDIPILTLALTSLWRRENLPSLRYILLPSLRYILLFWVMLWEARYLGFAPVTWMLNEIPGIAAADSARYSGPAVNFAVFALAALGFNDYQKLGPITSARISAVLLTLAAIIAAAVAPVFGLVRALYKLVPHDMLIALGTSTFFALILVFLCVELRHPRYRHALTALLIAGPLLTLMVPQFAGFRRGHIDTAPIRYLERHAGTSRMVTFGPLNLNFPSRYRIASIDYSALPVPALWSNYISTNLFPGADVIDFGGAPGQRAALLKYLTNYEAAGVRYVVTNPGEDFWSNAFPVVDAGRRNLVDVLSSSGPDIIGSVTPSLPFQSIGAMSVLVGTFYQTAHGPVLAQLCSAGVCATATSDALTAADNGPLTFKFPTPFRISPGATITFHLSHPSGTPLAVYFAPSSDGTEKPTLELIASRQNGGATLVFHDQTASIFELAHAASYAQAADSACKVSILNRQHFTTICPAATQLTRREMFFPGWSATVNGVAVAVSQAGLFQTIPVPRGTADIEFSYAPTHIRLACLFALLAAALWLGLALRNRSQTHQA